MGYAKAVVALARKVLIVAWRMLRTYELYRGVEPTRYQRKLKQLARSGLPRGLRRLGARSSRWSKTNSPGRVTLTAVA